MSFSERRALVNCINKIIIKKSNKMKLLKTFFQYMVTQISYIVTARGPERIGSRDRMPSNSKQHGH